MLTVLISMFSLEIFINNVSKIKFVIKDYNLPSKENLCDFLLTKYLPANAEKLFRNLPPEFNGSEVINYTIVMDGCVKKGMFQYIYAFNPLPYCYDNDKAHKPSEFIHYLMDKICKEILSAKS